MSAVDYAAFAVALPVFVLCAIAIVRCIEFVLGLGND